MRRVPWQALVVVLCTPGLARADAEDPETGSKRHFEEGRQQVKAQRCDLAVPEFRASIELRPAVGSWLNLAQCLETLGDYVAAHDAFLEAEALARTKADDRAQVAADAVARQAARATRLVVQLDDGEVSVDGVTVPRARWSRLLVTASQPHHVVALVDKTTRRERDVTGAPGETLTLDFRLPGAAPDAPRPVEPEAAAQPPAPRPVPLRTAGFITTGVGVAGLVGGAVMGGLALSARSSLADAIGADTRCIGVYPNETCDPSALGDLQPKEDRARNLALASTVVLVTGGVLVVTGLTLALVAGPRSAVTQAARVATHGITW